MTKNKEQICKDMEQIISSMLKGKRARTLLPLDEMPEDVKSFAEIFNRFISDIVECQDFIDNLVNGNLDSKTPARSNYAAGPLKELHSQLISMTINISDLCDGKMVSKLYYPGELFENYNKLISLVSQLMSNKDNSDTSPGVSSWTYHQVLAAINQLTVMVVQYDSTGKLVFANLAARKKLLNIEQLPVVLNSNEDDLLSYLGRFTLIVSSLKPHEAYSTRFPEYNEICDKKNDIWYSVETDIAKLADGKFGVIHMINDISEWKYNEQELKNEASRDPLTSTYTRKYGDKKFREMIHKRSSTDNCVGFVDLNGLKHINDNFGHTEGDFAIKTVASVIMSSVRDSDWVIRYGGDEFLILFANCTEIAARNAISRMHEQLDEINSSLNKPYTIEFSAGLSYIDDNMNDMQAIINEIDEKMYQDKTQRKAAKMKQPAN